MHLVQTTLCGMDNATPPPCEIDNATPSPCGMDNATPSICRMYNATPSPCRMDMQCHSLSMDVEWIIITCLEPITRAITTVDTLLLWVFVPPFAYDFTCVLA